MPIGTESRTSVMVASIAGMTAADVHDADLTATGGTNDSTNKYA